MTMKKALALVLLTLLLLTEALPASPTECKENEYLDSRGDCAPCKECGPGLELSMECGYGEGKNAQCTPCQPRRFKDSWSHHGCKPCLSCSLISRFQKANCTAVADATCGECFPGFYRKTQIGGLRDLECIPCTKQTPSSEAQCRSRVSLVKVGSPPAPAQDMALVVLVSSALVILVLVLLTVSILYCRRFWKIQCQRVFLRSQNFSGQRVLFQASAVPASHACQEQLGNPCCWGIKHFSPSHRLREGPVEVVQFLSEAETPGIPLPCQPPAPDMPCQLTSAGPTALLGRRSLMEAQPLLRSSQGGDCCAGGPSFPDPRSGGSGGDASDGPALLSSCATERQCRWPHAPVECTELDLQTFSAQAMAAAALVGTRSSEEAGSRALQGALGGRPVLAPEAPACCLEASQASCPSFRIPMAESGEQLGDELQSLVHEIGSIAQGVSTASLPESLVQSLALQLDLPLPELKNFSHLGTELGVPAHQLSQISGFKELLAFFTESGRPLPVFILALALLKLQRSDALRLLRDHCPGSQAQRGQQ